MPRESTTLLLGLAALILLAVGIPALGHFVRTTGTTTGTVASIEQRGFLVKTWEGKLADGFTFSVDATAPLRDYNVFVLQEAKRSGMQVRLDYVEDITAAPWRGETTTLVQQVTQIIPPATDEEAPGEATR